MDPPLPVLEHYCRICFDGDNVSAGKLVQSPCKCSGSISLVHESCLEKWLTISKREDCEICQFTFETVQVLPTLRQYIRDSGARVVCFQSLEWLAKLISFLLKAGFVSFLTYTWWTSRKTGGEDGHKGQRSEYVQGWETLAFVVGSCMILSISFIWGKRTLERYIATWKNWRMAHQRTRLVFTAERVETV